MDDTDLQHLRRCLVLAQEALEAGHNPFASLLVDVNGHVLAEAQNEAGTGDRTRHPEFALARWSIEHLTPDERLTTTVYTSGEHCPMCSAAHGWAGLGRIVYAGSAADLVRWRTEFGAPAGPVAHLPISQIVPGAVVEGPAPALAEELRSLHRRSFERQQSASDG